MATTPSAAVLLRRLPSTPWLHNLCTSTATATTTSTNRSHQFTFSTLASPSPPPSVEDFEDAPSSRNKSSNDWNSEASNNNNNIKSKGRASSSSFFPKRGQTLELECQTLAFKGKGLCKVADTGFIVMCDRALPGERFIGRVTRKKDTYAEVKKVKTITPHWDYVEAPCEYASHCGGCKTQNLLYTAQLRAKEQQVRELVVHVGKFSSENLEFAKIMRPIVSCSIQLHYRNKMEFSFGPKKWVPVELLEEQNFDNGYALGLHAPGFFDKVLNVEKCLLQSDPANRLCKIVGETQN